MRGIDGPGLHILDVLPQEFEHVKDIDAAVDARAQVRVSSSGLPCHMSVRSLWLPGALLSEQKVAEDALLHIHEGIRCGCLLPGGWLVIRASCDNVCLWLCGCPDASSVDIIVVMLTGCGGLEASAAALCCL